ncbi:DNA processing protein [Crossiella equi]|uniref:DNA processing protein n=1 Tax=Crossiella equi TaxID=130796 RepID=A0ABS5AKG5_9PSEU|nr:DNA-processing protein DprA [Crossiella equi]MBP2477067.1 DNA processing protein [Crossiella equi]
MSEPDPRVRLARAYLARVAEPPAPALTRFVDTLGPVEAATRVRTGEVPNEVASATEARREIDKAEADLAAAHALGARLLIPEDPDWPSWQFAAFGPAGLTGPLALWVHGNGALADVVERSVAIVGSRAATAYGEEIAHEFGAGLADLGVTVTSGAAVGIDAAAHRGALRRHGRTVAVVACGLDWPYPAAHTGLYKRILAGGGLVVSEYPPGARPAKHRFLIRNRLIAALSNGTVVVEAGARSGATNTAAHTTALGRPLMAVPGPVTSAMSIGTLALLRAEHAVPVGTAGQVVEAIGRLGVDLAEGPRGDLRDTDGLEPEALRVHEALPLRPGAHAEQLAVEAGLPLAKVRAVLPMLELVGLAQTSDEGWHRPARDR